MNIKKRTELICRYGSAKSFLEKADLADFLWGISDLYGYEFPSDIPLLGSDSRRIVLISLFLKEFCSGGYASVISNIPEFLIDINNELQLFNNAICLEYSSIINMAIDEGVDFTNDDMREDFLESHHYFKASFLASRSSVAGLITQFKIVIANFEGCH